MNLIIQPMIPNFPVLSNGSLAVYNCLAILLTGTVFATFLLFHYAADRFKGNKLTIKDIEKLTVKQYVGIEQRKLMFYKPKPVKRVEILKLNGKMRPLGIPTMIDRLVQQCILQVMEPICEAKFFERSNGFRPNGMKNKSSIYGAFRNTTNLKKCISARTTVKANKSALSAVKPWLPRGTSRRNPQCSRKKGMQIHAGRQSGNP